MNLERLELFLKIVDTGSLRGASSAVKALALARLGVERVSPQRSDSKVAT